jgi:hypothetical protein
MFYQNHLAMRNTVDVTGGPSQSISGVSAVNSLIAFYDIHGRKREVQFFYIVSGTTRDNNNLIVTVYKILAVLTTLSMWVTFFSFSLQISLFTVIPFLV